MLYGFTNYLPEAYLTIYDMLELIARIVISGVLGMVIGFERTQHMKEAGIRTHIIIACAASVFMIISKYGYVDLAAVLGYSNAAPGRVASQVVNGISFLGAGVIIKYGNAPLRGLTTAGGLWATAAVGMSIGAGFYWVGILLAFLLLLTQLLLHHFPMGNDPQRVQTITVSMDDTRELRSAFGSLLKAHGGEILQCDTTCTQGHITMVAVIRVKHLINYQTSMAFLNAHPGVNRISI